ncbi:MAG TPA: hypothetical protein VIM42_09210 [Clostridium sp.]
MVNEKRNVWVILDSKGNYSGGIRRIENEDIYISWKSFGPECRAYLNLEKATNVIWDLRASSNAVGLDETFYLDYVVLEDIIAEHKDSSGVDLVMAS